MKIRLLLLATLVLVGLAGCAVSPPRGGPSEATIEDEASPIVGSGASGVQDYKQVLASPGRF